MKQIEFSTSDKGKWLDVVYQAHQKYNRADYLGENTLIGFAPEIQINTLKPFHIVTYACLIHYLVERGYSVRQNFQRNPQCSDYVFNRLGLKEYWKGANHIEINDTSILNIWRIVQSELDFFSVKVSEYFKTRYFQNKDLSAVSNSIVEAFYNIFDHADADGNAFCLVQYDEVKHELSVAISDFGRGLVNTVKEFDHSIKTDTDAMTRAISTDFTISSTSHNKGYGLDNILSSVDEARIVSGNAFLYKNAKGALVRNLSFTFPGTLIYFDINLSNLDDIDIIDSFNF